MKYWSNTLSATLAAMCHDMWMHSKCHVIEEQNDIEVSDKIIVKDNPKII